MTLAEGVTVAPGARRTFMTTSACGICGKASIQDICVLPHAALAGDPTRFAPAMLAMLPGRLLAAVSAPSSLVVELAEEAGLTLVGFLRGPSMNVYTGTQRLSA